MSETKDTNVNKHALELLEAHRIIKMASEVAAKTALETVERKMKEAQESRQDRRLRNTKLLLRKYRELKIHCSNAIYDKQKMIEAEGYAIDILDDLMETVFNEDVYVQSIRRSMERTSIIMAHVDEMLQLYEIYSSQKGKVEKRRYRTIHSYYIREQGMTIEEIAVAEYIDIRTVYKDIDAACETLAGFLFGVDGLKR